MSFKRLIEQARVFLKEKAVTTLPAIQNKADLLKLSAKYPKVREKMDSVMDFYEHAAGVHEVRAFQDRVVDAQDRFQKTKDLRLAAFQELSSVDGRISEIGRELRRLSKEDDRYLELTIDEIRLLKEQKELKRQFELFENLERESFHNLTMCMKDSLEREKTISMKVRYIAAVASLIACAVGIIGNAMLSANRNQNLISQVESTLNNHLALDVQSSKKTITDFVNVSNNRFSSLRNDLLEIKSVVTKLENYMSSNSKSLPDNSSSWGWAAKQAPLKKNEVDVLKVSVISGILIGVLGLCCCAR